MFGLLNEACHEVADSERKKAVLTGTFSSVGARGATFELVSGMTPNGVEAMVFTKDGKRLFCGTRDGIYVVDAEKDELEMWTKTFLYTNTQGHHFSSLIALAPDEKDLYAGLRLAEKDGAVVAIDVAQKKVVRKLELSKTGCTSVAVAKGKLFAACLDGVYMIDIDRWRIQK